MSTASTTIDAFEISLAGSEPPCGCGLALAALWWARREDWEAAHGLVQDTAGAEAAWVHPWLHRMEGDEANAAYWYRRAGQPAARGPLDREWRTIVGVLLGSAGRHGQ